MASKSERLLLLQHLFLTETDENHYITMEEIARRLQADRRTIEQDIDTLIQSGMDIEKKPRPKLSYAVLSRDFTLEEIKLLLDCVQVSKFLSGKKTEELTKKLCGLCSKHEAAQLSGQVLRNHIKSGNEGVYRHIDTIQKAIDNKKILSFQILKYPSPTERAREQHIVIPYALIYTDDTYYLVAHEIEGACYFCRVTDKLQHFRIDCLEQVEIINTRLYFSSNSKIDYQIDKEEQNRDNFSIYGGNVEQVTIQFPNSLAWIVFDRFGEDVHILQVENNQFRISEKIAINPQFYGWVCSLGKDVRIINPPYVVREFKKWIKNVYSSYEKSESSQ